MYRTLDKIDLLHHLPMTVLEKLLKQNKSQNLSYHNRVLTSEEMTEYILWMARHSGQKEQYQLQIDDISILTGEGVANASHDLLHNMKNPQMNEHISAIFTHATEVNFFSKQQNIAAGRFLRHMPAYWQSSDFFEVYYVFSGECPVWFEDEEIIQTPGTVLLIPPGTSKACHCPSDDCVMFFYMIRSSTFSQIFWEQLSKQNLMSLFFKQALGRKSKTAYLRFETGCDTIIEFLLYSIFQEYDADNTYSSQMTNSLMSTFFVCLLQHYEQTATVSKNSKFYWKPEFASIFSYIQEHYQTVTVAELSHIFHYSQRQIIRIIRNSTAKTFSQLLTQLRMERAAALLSSKDAAIEEIAEQAGYSSLSSFYRVFGNYYGMTPKEYRKQLLK